MDGQTLLVANVHGINRAPRAAFKAQIDALVERLRTHVGPMLFAGDFNTQSKAKISYLEEAAAMLQLSRVQFSPDHRTVSKLSHRPLDDVFVRGAAIEASECWLGGGSDHVAMAFDLVF